MFGKKKKKTLINDVFGEMEYWCGWHTKATTEITLWNKTYSIKLYAVTITEKDEINDNQKEAYRKFMEIIVDRKKEIEEIIAEHYQIRDEEQLAARIVPGELHLCRQGECALYIDDKEEITNYGPYDDYDIGFVIGIIPELTIYTQEEYDGYLFSGGIL